MMKIFKAVLPALCLVALILAAKAQEHSVEESVLQDLVIAVAGEEYRETPVPADLRNIVENFYADEIVDDKVAVEVLSYLTDIYSEHGYYESGAWGAFGVHSLSVPSYLRSSNQEIRYTPVSGSDMIQMPISGRYTSYYGYRPKFGRFHKGIDISLNIGDTVRSVLPGIVVSVKCDPRGYGNYVVVSHDGGLETLYGHLSKGLVSPGQKLNTGDAVGLGGVSGNATGPHLHFETKMWGESINPLFYLPNAAERK